MREPAGQSPIKSESASALARGSAAESERVLLLEIRMDKLSSALTEARGDADRLLGRLAAAAAREADQARRFSFVQQELADARAEIASLREQLTRSEALRSRLEGHLFEGGAGSDVAELLQLRQEVAVERERAQVNEQTAARLRARADELLMSRDTLFSRMAEWHSLVQTGNSDAVDLGEFIASLRQDIMTLEDRTAEGDKKEKALRELLARAGVEPAKAAAREAAKEAAVPAPTLPSPVPEEPSEPELADVQGALTFEGFLGTNHHSDHELSDSWDADEAPAEENATTGQEPEPEPVESTVVAWSEPEETFAAVVDPEPEEELVPAAVAASAPTESTFELVAQPHADGLSAADPVVRAASFGRLNRDLEDRPSQLTDHLRSGLADVDPRVRRRAVLAAATARNVELRPLLEPLRNDPDPQVRRVVREVLRYAPAAEYPMHDSAELR
jgi:hypothetical protein